MRKLTVPEPKEAVEGAQKLGKTDPHAGQTSKQSPVEGGGELLDPGLKAKSVGTIQEDGTVQIEHGESSLETPAEEKE